MSACIHDPRACVDVQAGCGLRAAGCGLWALGWDAQCTAWTRAGRLLRVPWWCWLRLLRPAC